jgi:hypothetical protein
LLKHLASLWDCVEAIALCNRLYGVQTACPAEASVHTNAKCFQPAATVVGLLCPFRELLAS